MFPASCNSPLRISNFTIAIMVIVVIRILIIQSYSQDFSPKQVSPTEKAKSHRFSPLGGYKTETKTNSQTKNSCQSEGGRVEVVESNGVQIHGD